MNKGGQMAERMDGEGDGVTDVRPAGRTRPKTPPGWCVTPGVWATAMPFPSVMGYSYSYAVEVPSGLIIVDLGWDTDAGWAAFEAGLARAGHSVNDIVGVVGTHVHPDHYGLAGRIRSVSDAWIAVHEAERPQIVSPGEHAERIVQLTAWLKRCGVPDRESLRGEVSRLVDTTADVQPDRTLVDGAVVPDTGGSLEVIHTPGHTAGHLCFLDRERGVLFTGDHLLPRVTPNISKRPGSCPDPLAEFENSLRHVAEVRHDTLVLPGHEWPFDHPSQRVSTLLEHHRQRLTEVADAVCAGAGTVWEVASTVRWSRRFADFDARAQRQALGEVHAHLHRLAASGRISVAGDDNGAAALVWSANRTHSSG
jgi:glyoxylase-like metal-dependent hydrolase (beta-lactamase superfamily II)